MIGTFFVAVAALVVAILGCAWAKPVGVKDSIAMPLGFGGRDAGQRGTVTSARRSIEHAVRCRHAATRVTHDSLTGANYQDAET